MAALGGNDPVDAPPSNQGVLHLVGAAGEVLVLAERQVIRAAEVEDVSDIEVGQTPIETGAKAGHVRRAIPAVLPPFSRSPASDSVFDQV